MIEFFRNWYWRYFSHPQAVVLAVSLVLSVLLFVWAGHMLGPVLAALVLAYLLESPTRYLERWGVRRILAVVFVFSVFLALLVLVVVGLIPALSHQLTNFTHELPRMALKGREVLARISSIHPQVADALGIDHIVSALQTQLSEIGQSALSLSLASISAVMKLMVYLVLAPVLVFFFLKDKDLLVAWLLSFLPTQRQVLVRVWREMDEQIGNYIRGKIYQAIIVGVVCYVTFGALNLAYTPLLAVVVGVSVVVPYIGAVIAILPVAIVGYSQFGWSDDYAWVVAALSVILTLDGNLLVPLLFSDVVKLHPVAIIIAVLVFGELWGFWGVFFAIPLATLVKCLLRTWPRSGDAADLSLNNESCEPPAAVPPVTL